MSIAVCLQNHVLAENKVLEQLRDAKCLQPYKPAGKSPPLLVLC